MPDLANHVAIVTGASSGIGEATAVSLADAGATVVAAARREERLNGLVKRIEESGGRAVAHRCDVTDREQVQQVADAATSQFGRIDILINNAGVMPVSAIAERRYDDWDRMLDVNVKGALYAIGAVLPTMLEQRSGHIVNVSSVAGRHIFPGNVVYCATKHALHVISEGLRSELASADPPQKKIRVTTIAPGIVITELPESSTTEAGRSQIREYYQSLEHPLLSEDIARAIRFAVESPEHVNVNEIVVRPTEQVR